MGTGVGVPAVTRRYAGVLHPHRAGRLPRIPVFAEPPRDSAPPVRRTTIEPLDVVRSAAQIATPTAATAPTADAKAAILFASSRGLTGTTPDSDLDETAISPWTLSVAAVVLGVTWQRPERDLE